MLIVAKCGQFGETVGGAAGELEPSDSLDQMECVGLVPLLHKFWGLCSRGVSGDQQCANSLFGWPFWTFACVQTQKSVRHIRRIGVLPNEVFADSSQSHPTFFLLITSLPGTITLVHLSLRSSFPLPEWLFTLILSNKTSLRCAWLTEAVGQTTPRGQMGHFVFFFFQSFFMILCHCIKLLRESSVARQQICFIFHPQFIRQCRLCVWVRDPLLLHSILQCTLVSSSMNPSCGGAANQIRVLIVAGVGWGGGAGQLLLITDNSLVSPAVILAAAAQNGW